MAARRAARRRPGWIVAIVPAILALWAPVAAPAHPSGSPVDPRVAALIGDHVEPVAGGYEVEVGGGLTLLTHGPDPAPDPAFVGDELAPRSTSEREPACADDHYQHALLAHPIGTPAPGPEAVETVRTAIGRMNQTLAAAAQATGGTTADFKFLCTGGEVRIDSLVTTGTSFEDVVRSAKLAGFDRPATDYSIFLAADVDDELCGIATIENDSRLIATNASVVQTGYAITYARCWLGGTPLHESGHNQGAVAYGAPHSTGTGRHCNQRSDVMCYAPDGGDRNQLLLPRECRTPSFDCGGDDYFDAEAEAGEYLADHWNIGSRLNPFIEFDRGAIGDYTPADPPPPVCERPRCARPLRLERPKRGSIANGSVALYRVELRERRRWLEVTARARTRVAVSVERQGVNPGSGCARPRRAAGELATGCRVRRPARGSWFVGISARKADTVEFEVSAAAG